MTELQLIRIMALWHMHSSGVIYTSRLYRQQERETLLTYHISPMDHNKSGRRPTRAGRNANATEQANENICDVAVMSV